MTGSAEDAEDLLQDVFLQAHRKLRSFRGESTLGTWLYRLAMNHCLDHLRGRQAKMGRVTESLDDEDAAEPAAPAPAVPLGHQPHRSRTRDRRRCRRVPCGVSPPRCGRIRAPRGGGDPRHLGRHLEITGAQGAREAARDTDDELRHLRTTCSATTSMAPEHPPVPATSGSRRSSATCRPAPIARRSLADFTSIRRAASMLEEHVPPPRLWTKIAASIEEEQRPPLVAACRWPTRSRGGCRLPSAVSLAIVHRGLHLVRVEHGAA